MTDIEKCIRVCPFYGIEMFAEKKDAPKKFRTQNAPFQISCSKLAARRLDQRQMRCSGYTKPKLARNTKILK